MPSQFQKYASSLWSWLMMVEFCLSNTCWIRAFSWQPRNLSKLFLPFQLSLNCGDIGYKDKPLWRNSCWLALLVKLSDTVVCFLLWAIDSDQKWQKNCKKITKKIVKIVKNCSKVSFVRGWNRGRDLWHQFPEAWGLIGLKKGRIRNLKNEIYL